MVPHCWICHLSQCPKDQRTWMASVEELIKRNQNDHDLIYIYICIYIVYIYIQTYINHTSPLQRIKLYQYVNRMYIYILRAYYIIYDYDYESYHYDILWHHLWIPTVSQSFPWTQGDSGKVQYRRLNKPSESLSDSAPGPERSTQVRCSSFSIPNDWRSKDLY